jgi:hypothetical protein
MNAKYWDGPPIEAWEPWTSQEAAARLAGVSAPWCVVGGWALDLWLGEQTRPHEDLEIAISRDDLARVRRALGLPFHAVGDGEVRLLADGEATPEHRHQNWVCEEGRWRLDVMLEPGDAQTWIYRRDPQFRASRAWMTGTSAEGIAYLRPQGVLFYKARAPRPKDEADLAAALPKLEPEARAWLAEAIARFEPASPWRARFD